MWAILTDPAKANGGWREDEFFATGAAEVQGIMDRIARLRFPAGRKRALDFGSGMGRVTQPLCDHFESVTGVDISPAMIELAERRNRYGARCQYLVNRGTRLGALPRKSFDLVYSNITLQHIRPSFVKRYLTEFMSLLVPDGLLLFQLPGRSRRIQPGFLGAIRYRVGRNFFFTGGASPMYVNGIPKEQVLALLESRGGRTLAVEPNSTAGPDFESYLYAITPRRLR